MAIRWDKFTVKAQEAVQRANSLASEHGNPELMPVHLLAALVEDKEGIVPPVLEKIGIGPQAVLHDAYGAIESLPKVSGGAAQATLSNSANQLLEQAFKEASNFKDEYVSTEHLLLAATATQARSGAGNPGPPRRNPRRHSESADLGPRLAEGDRPESRSQVSGAGALCSRPDRAGAPRQARSRDRPRRRNPPRGAGAFPAHQEQSGADRRARRGQDRHRGRPGAAHHLGRRARRAEEQARGRARSRLDAGGREVSRRV